MALSSIIALSACTNDVWKTNNSEYVNSVKVTVEDFVPAEPSSRTAYTVDGTGFHFQWADSDALGIYPIGGDQVKFPISAGDGSSAAAFDGGSWALRSTYRYAAYYPFSESNYTTAQTALPISYTGQAQSGNGSTDHLGKYDFLACAATAPDDNGGVNLTMKHLGAFVRLKLTMPKADTFSSVELESDGAEFVTAGTFDLTAATPAITSTTTSSTYTVDLSNLSTSAASEVITVYCMVAPADLSAGNITVTVHGAEQTTYVATVTGKNFKAGSAYNVAITSFPSGTNASGEDASWDEEESSNTDNGHEYVDLGITDDNGKTIYWATTNVGADSPEEYGDYFAWGETTGYNSEKKSFKWSTYKWMTEGEGSYEYCTKYTRADGLLFACWYSGETYVGTTVDGVTYKEKTVLDLSDDAARTNWGGSWRIPTAAEQKKLVDQCYWEWTDSYNSTSVAGYIVYNAKTDADKGLKKYRSSSTTTTGSYSLNDTHIFLPAAGTRQDSGSVGADSYGKYWSCSLGEDSSTACTLAFGCSNVYTSRSYRHLGISVRAVRQ